MYMYMYIHMYHCIHFFYITMCAPASLWPLQCLFLSPSPQRIVHQRVLPALSSEFRNTKMIPFVLPLVLLIAEDCTLQEYCTLIMPVITPALHVQNPIQVHNVWIAGLSVLPSMPKPKGMSIQQAFSTDFSLMWEWEECNNLDVASTSGSIQI